MTSIAIADDSEVIRNLIAEIIRYEPQLELAGSFENGREIVAWTREGGRADIYLIDMRLPGLSGTATIRALRRFLDDVRIIAFSASAQEASVESAIAAGADQYVVKDASLSELLDALRAPSATTGDATPDGVAAADSAAATSQPGAGTYYTVLVVDDHEIVRETTAALLASRGIESVCFEDGDAALQWISDGGEPAAALIDLRIGGSRDTSLVRKLRELLPNTAVYVHSGVSQSEGAQVAASTGADGFIAKGELAVDDLIATIEKRRAQPA
jgi:DNA-binding NarL/FixJ family response regulator